MNRKRLITMVVAVVLVAIVGIGATLAYFTDQKSVENVFTMGRVGITLTENEVIKGDDGDYTADQDVTEEGLKFDDLVPGQVVPKNPTITVNGDSEDVYIRATMKVVSDEIDQAMLDVLEEALLAQIQAGGDWSLDNGYFYYAWKMKAGDKAVLFDTVTIPPAWGNAEAGKSFEILVQAYAIQADYLEDDVVIFANGKAIRWENLEYVDFQ